MIQGNLLIIAIVIFAILLIGLVMTVQEFRTQTPTQPELGKTDAGIRRR